MIYQYRCDHCGIRFDVVKSATLMEREETCDKCHLVASREFVPSRVFFNGTKVEHAEYNPGLGCIVRNKAHRKELCKIKGVEEIGNETPDKIHKHFEQKRQENWDKSWEDTTQGWVGDGSS